MTLSPTQLLNAVKASGVSYNLVPGWDDPKIAASGHWSPVGVLLHHTAGRDSLHWVLHDQFYPIRACHFLIDRDGLVHVVYALKCYHAGKGGPTKVGNVTVPQDSGNGYFLGIEIESLGTSLDNSGANGYTDKQVEAASRLTASLLDAMNVPTSASMNHKDYAPGRKQDTLMAKQWWWTHIQKYRHSVKPKPPAPVQQYRQGKKVYSSKMKAGQMNSDSVWNLALALINKGYGRAIRVKYHGATDDYVTEVINCTRKFQIDQGWSGHNADGIAGPETIKRLGLTWVEG